MWCKLNLKYIYQKSYLIYVWLAFNIQYNFIHAEINNLSWKFDKPEGAETHFELTVVAIDFESMKKEQVKYCHF